MLSLGRCCRKEPLMDRYDYDVSIVSDSPILSEGLAALLKAHAGIEPARRHSGLLLDAPGPTNVADGEGKIGAFGPPWLPNPPGYVMLVDGGMGREAVVAWTQYGASQAPPARVVVIELPEDMDFIGACMGAGAVGCVARGGAVA